MGHDETTTNKLTEKELMMQQESVSGSPNIAYSPLVTPKAKAKDDTCGECYQCVSSKYDSEDPGTHCVDCTCFLCIPGA
jgi:hypothetical protein